jgi:hypothetical protein
MPVSRASRLSAQLTRRVPEVELRLASAHLAVPAGQRRSTLQTYLQAALDAAITRLQAVEVAVGSVAVTGATVDAHVHGDALPRRFEDVSLVSAI